MSNERWGVRFSEEGKDVSNSEELVYDSDLDQLKVSTVANPSHLRFFQPLPTMNNLTAGSSNPVASEDLIPPIKHNLPYTPSVWIYFNVVDAPAGVSLLIGRYVINFIRLGPTLIYAYADENYVYIKHDFYYTAVPPPGTPVDPQTETGADIFKLRVKLLILNGRYVGQVYKTTP